MAKLILGRRYEAKTLDITVLDTESAAVVLTGKSLRFTISKSGAAAEAADFILTKTTIAGITITGAGFNVARIDIDADPDYDDLPAGLYYGELRSMTDDLVYWPRVGEDEGDIEVLPGSPGA